MAPEPPNHPALIYVNWIRTQGTPYELAIDLGYRVTEEPPEEFPARIVMTWEHAKDMVQIVSEAVKQYEANIGTVRDYGGRVVSVGEESEEDTGDA